MVASTKLARACHNRTFDEKTLQVVLLFFVHTILPDHAFTHWPRFHIALSCRSLGHVLILMWLIVQKNQLNIVSLVNLYLTNYLILCGLIKQHFLAFLYLRFCLNCLVDFYVLHTYSSLCFYSNLKTTFNLHVLSMLLVFILSQDQTFFVYYDFLHRSRF